MNIEDRIARLEAAVFDSAPHPLEGLEYYSPMLDGDGWHGDPTNDRPDFWTTAYQNYPMRDAATKVSVPPSEVARRLGIKAALPDLTGKKVEFTQPLGYTTATAPTAAAMDNPLYQVGDLVEVVIPFTPWFEAGERFVVEAVTGTRIERRDGMGLPSYCVRLIYRP